MPPEIGFRPVTAADYPMLLGWLNAPHIREWWGEPEAELDGIRGKVEGRDSTRPFIIEADGVAVGYIQVWFADDNREVPDYPWIAALPAGAVGVDLSIGDPALLSRGLGSAALAAFVARLRAEGRDTIVIDPDAANARAVRAYEKAGFRPVPALLGQSGGSLIMQHTAEAPCPT